MEAGALGVPGGVVPKHVDLEQENDLGDATIPLQVMEGNTALDQTARQKLAIQELVQVNVYTIEIRRQMNICSVALKVDGSWGSWGSWESCSKTCGSGTRKSSRRCNNPTPSNGGKFCTGSSSSSETCNNGCKVDGNWGS